ncbi:comC, partial [Symbiodinium sp. KB8]
MSKHVHVATGLTPERSRKMKKDVSEEEVVKDFIDAGGATDDLIVRTSTFAEKYVQGSCSTLAKDSPVEGSRRLDFDYLEKFMAECFMASGTPEKESKVCANVLIEADKRGIDSHGIG